MYENIYKISEIRNDKDGPKEVNSFLEKGWTLISVCQVGNAEHMDIVYVVGATKEIYDATFPKKETPLSKILSEYDT